MGSNGSKKYGALSKIPTKLLRKDYEFFTHQTGFYYKIYIKKFHKKWLFLKGYPKNK